MKKRQKNEERIKSPFNLLSQTLFGRLSWILLGRLSWILLPIFYILLIEKNIHFGFIQQFFILITSLISYFLAALFINDYFDKEKDKKAGKKRFIHELSEKESLVLIIILSILSLSTGFYLAGFDALIYLIGLFLALFYSFPPIRLKERGILGIFVDILIEFSPFLFIFFFFNFFTFDAIIILSSYLIFQFASMMEHQIIDHDKDIKSRTETFITNIGPKKGKEILNKFCFLSTIFIALIFYLFLRIEYFWIIILFLLVLHTFHFIIIRKGIGNEFLVPLYFGDFVYIGIFEVVPLYFSFILFLKSPYYLPLFILAIISVSDLLYLIIKRTNELLGN